MSIHLIVLSNKTLPERLQCSIVNLRGATEAGGPLAPVEQCGHPGVGGGHEVGVLARPRVHRA